MNEEHVGTLYKNLATYLEAISPLMSKIEMAKDGKWIFFVLCKCEQNLPFQGQIQSKPIYGLITYKLAGPKYVTSL